MNAVSWTRLPEGLAACLVWPVEEALPAVVGQKVEIDGTPYKCIAVQRLYRDRRKRKPAERIAVVVESK